MSSLSGLMLFTEHVLGRELEQWEKRSIEIQFDGCSESESVEKMQEQIFETNEILKKARVQIIANARKLGVNSFLKQLVEDYHPLGMELKPISVTTPRRCDCLKCRMGKLDQCTTYSPRKRGRK